MLCRSKRVITMSWLSGLVLFSCGMCVCCFNLETRIPVLKLGEPGSYFGFSVAEHQTVHNDSDPENWLLVGAPLDQNLQPGTNRSGALWKCPLTQYQTDCKQIIVDGRLTDDGDIKSIESNELRAPRRDEIKNGQWLGVTVRSQGVGGKVAVCAHRYMRLVGQSQLGQGLCYVLDNYLGYKEFWQPCNGRPFKSEHEEFGFCQAGSSSSFLDDGTLLVGSPGTRTWRGTVFDMDFNDEYLERDHVYLGPTDDINSPVPKYSYLGISVAGAKFFSDASMAYAAGAPRANGSGQVVLFAKRTTFGSMAHNILNVTMIIDGDQFGSSFGYEVTAADVSGDGVPDLLVGAPFHFTRDTGGAVYVYINDHRSLPQKFNIKLTGKPESQFGISIANVGDLNKDGCDDIAIGSPYDGNGIVSIYLGHRKDGLYKEPKQIIRAESLPLNLKTFGYALSGGIDLDGNGYPDVLVGAYFSSAVALLRSRPIIDIKTFINLKNSDMTIDPTKNGCVADRDANYTCFHFEACCKIEAIVNGLRNGSSTYKLKYVIEAETYPGGRKFSRVFFGSTPNSPRSNIIDRNIEVSREQPECNEHIVYLKENTRDIQSPVKFKLSYSLVQSKPQYSTRGPLPDIDQYPVLNATATNDFEAIFLNDCGPDNVCVSDLVLSAQLDLPHALDKDAYILTLGQEDEIRLMVMPDNEGESAYESHIYVSHHEGLHYIAANVTDKNVICNIHNASMVACSLGNPFKKQLAARAVTLRFDPRSLADHELSVKFYVWLNSTSREKTPGRRPVAVEAQVVKNAELYIRGISTPEQVFYGGEVKGESAMKYLDELGSRVVHTYQVFNEGPWRVASVKVVVWWPQQVASDKPQGKWLLYPDDKPTVDTPGGGECFVSSKYINPLELKKREGVNEPPIENLIKLDSMLEESKYGSRQQAEVRQNESKRWSSASDNRVRRKRDSEMIVKPEAYTDKDGQRRLAVDLSCRNGTAKCIKMHCLVYKLARGQVATINVFARLWNATLVEEYPRVGHVAVASAAHIELAAHYNIHQDRLDDDSATVSTVAYPDLKTTEPSEAPLWVIIAAVVAGLIVLILLILALWKFGFFKRSRPDPTLSGNLEKNTHEASPFLVRDRNSLR